LVFKQHGTVCHSWRSSKSGVTSMRLFIAATVAASLFATNLSAAETGPLAAGKPAGVQKADAADATLWWIIGGAVFVGVVAAVASGGGSSTITSPANVPPTTS